MKLFGYEIIIRKQRARNEQGQFVSEQKHKQDAMTKQLKAEQVIDWDAVRKAGM